MNRKLAGFENVDERVPHAALGELIPIQRADNAGVRKEDDLDQVFKTASYGLDARSVRLATEERTSTAPGMRTIRTMQIVTVRIAGCEIEPTIRAKGDSVETAVVAVTEPGQDDGSFVRAAIGVGVL